MITMPILKVWDLVLAFFARRRHEYLLRKGRYEDVLSEHFLCQMRELGANEDILLEFARYELTDNVLAEYRRIGYEPGVSD